MSDAEPDAVPSRAHVASVDAAWLRMDDPTNLMVVTGLLVLDTPVTFARVRHLLESRLSRFPRFRQRIVDESSGVPVGTPVWEDDPAFDIARHVTSVHLPAPVDERTLQDWVSSLMSEPLPTNRPLWHFYFVPHFQGGSAVVGRIHHVIGDGLALIYVILTLADDGPEPPVVPDLPDAAEEDEGPWGAAARSIRAAVQAAASLPGSILREAGELLSNPSRIVDATGQAGAAVGSLARLVMMEADPDTRLRGPLSATKRVTWSRAFSVADMKRIGKATGATINDVLMSAVSGALRRYLAQHGAVAADLNVRAVIPVNLRRLEDAHQLGNQFGLVFLSLPLGMEETLERVFEVRRRMDALKRSPEAYVVFQLLRTIGAGPRPIFELVLDMFSKKGTAVVTNVIGPREPIALAGSRMRQAMFWVPSAGRLGLGMSLLSYAGQVWIGIQTDAGLIPDPERILQGFYEEIDQMLALASEVGA